MPPHGYLPIILGEEDWMAGGLEDWRTGGQQSPERPPS